MKRKHSEEEDLPVSFEDISAAAFRIKSGCRVTPCTYSPGLSKLTGCKIWLKHDHQQTTGSFKERGALNALLLLDKAKREKGVICASAGNHAMAVSYHGQRLGIPVTVVVPTMAPLTKVTNCIDFGATVHIQGETIAESKEYCHQLMATSGQTYINGYDDPDIIAGAGTVGVEVVEQVESIDALLVPVGGGGLVAGCSLAIKKLRPEVLVIGVEPANCASMTAALAAGHPVRIDSKPTLADGLAVPMVGENAYAIAKGHMDKIVTVKECAVALSVLRLLEKEKMVVEGGGAAGLAALIPDNLLPELKGKNVVILLCGGNIDVTMMGRVIERGLAAEGRLLRFVANVPDRAGGLLHLVSVIAATGASVKDVFHERAFLDSNVSGYSVYVRCVVETRNKEHATQLLGVLRDEGMLVEASESK